jgi:hypothetical protein
MTDDSDNAKVGSTDYMCSKQQCRPSIWYISKAKNLEDIIDIKISISVIKYQTHNSQFLAELEE